MKIATHVMTFTVPVRRHDPAISKWGTVPDGTKTGTVELTVDMERLCRQLADKALRSKGKRSTMASGAITAKAHSIIHEKEAT